MLRWNLRKSNARGARSLASTKFTLHIFGKGLADPVKLVGPAPRLMKHPKALSSRICTQILAKSCASDVEK